MLFVTFCKDAYEDLKRWRDDCRVNQQTCKVFSGNDGRDNFDTVKWSEVKVGNFVKLFRDQPVPADMLLVYSTTGSVAYVDTAQLDGESSLKPKHSADETQHMIRNASLRSVEGHMEADLPNELVGRFDGCLYLKGYPRGGLKNMLLRGSTIRNTSYVIAFVVYTGADTKVVRNSSRSLTSKRSQVEVTSNKLLTIVFLMLFIISIASALARAWLLADATGSKNLSWAWPLTGGDDLQDNPYMAILTFLIGYNNLIPISLYMTTDLVRALQAFIMESDESMYYKEGDVHCTVRSSGLCEDLGQVDFVLSDKTGTLTQNEMCFKACHVAGQTYGYWSDTPDESREGDTSQGINAEFFGYPSDHIERIPSRSVCFPLSPYMWNVPYDGEPGLGLPSPNNHLIHNFFLCLATCHTAMPERMPPVTPQKRSNGLMQSLQDLDFVSQNDPAMQCLRDEAGVENRMQLLEEANSTAFRSPSPDEEALLAMARDFGFYYKKRNGNRLTINIRGQEVYYSVLMCNEFSSERKRMSVLVRQCSGNDPPANPQSSHMVSAFMAPQGVTSMENLGGQLEDGQYILFAKGADSVMMERMRQDDQETSNSRCLNMDMEVSDKLLAESPRHNLNGAIPEGFEAAMASEAGSEGDRPATPDPAPPAPTEPAPPLSLEVADPQGLASLELGAHVASAHLGVPPAPKSGASSFQDDRSYLAAAASGMVSWSVRTQPSQEVNVEENKQQKKLKAAKEQLRHFSTHGLRTLVCGYRVLPDAEAECYIKRYGEARGTFFNRDELMAKVMDEMERDLDLLGITAVEDKIQIGVPETVKMLLDGGIRVWMLTGDCVETAVNIGSICRLVNKDCRMYYLTSEDGADQSLEKTRDDLLNKLRRMEACVIEGLKNHSAEAFKYSLVLNGAALYAILEESAMELQQLFVTVVCNSYSVIACRLSPAQKAAVVELIRTQVPGNPLTLAVGDGGNDVSMIQKAHVGVGIAGAEGREAVNAADFAIGQFRFLRSLLFLHGRSNIRRIGIVIGYSFYKNFLLVICMACYAPFNGFSGTTFYDSYLIMMYNMVFTNLPIFVVGALDVDVYAPAAFALPKLYLFGANKVYFNYRMLIAWLGRGVVHAFVNFFVATLFLGGSGGQPAGLTDYLSLGTWSYWSCVLVANSTLLLHAQVWMDWQILISIISVMLFPPILFIYSNPSMSNLLNPSFNDVATNLFESIPGWLSLLLVLALSVLVELAMDAWRRVNRPDLTTRVQEFQRNKTTFAGESFAAARPTAFSTMTPIHPASSPSVDHARLGTQNSRSFGTDAKLTTVIPKVPGVGERSPCANVLTQTGQELQLQSGISKTERLYPESLVTSLPYSYKRSGYNQGDFRAEAMELKEFAQDSKHPPIKQPGLSLIMEGLVRNRDGSIGLAHLGRWWGEEWRARLSYLQWSQISLMSDVLGGKDANHVEEDVTQNIAEKLSQITGMQRELLHLDHLEPRDEETTTGPQAAPVDYRQSRFNVNYTTEFVYNIFTLKFRSKFHEQAFCQNFDHTSRNQFFVSVRSVTWVIIVGFQLVKLIALLAAKDSESIPQTLLIIFGAVAASEIILFPLRFKIMDSIQASYVAIICCSLMIAKHAYEIVADVPGYVSDAIMPLFFCAGVRMRFPVVVFVLFLHMVLLVLHQRLFLTEVTCTVGNGNTASSVCDQNGGLKAEYSVVQFGLVLLVGTYVYVSERFARHSFAWDDRIGSARNADRDLLKGMYPEDVVEAVRTSFRFNQNQSKDTQIASVSSTETIFQERGVVTVVFIDIYDFERVVAHLGPGDLVAMLDRVFTQMDLVCQEHDVVKIETVGKTFMAAGMTGDKKKHGKLGRSGNGKDSVQKKAVKCLEVAVAILRQFSKCATGMNGMERLSLKIGINTGQVISGVVGSQKPQFALFGDTVNTASRMMSTGKVNHIHISKQTYDYVEDDDRFKWTQQQIEAKGKGIMTTYLLWNEKRQNENGHVVRQKSHREGSILELASSDVVPSTEETTWHACPQLRLSNLPKAISDGWHFCVKVYELDSGRTQQGGSMLGSSLLFWLCFGMESWFIIHGDTGQNASGGVTGGGK
ncbi:unnamed protein product [Effrenium voratum]|nr:unnamed protein product [Effrenium voratum]